MLFISECTVVYYSISCWWWMGKRLIFDWIYRQMSNLIFQSWETFTKLIFCKRLMGLTFFLICLEKKTYFSKSKAYLALTKDSRYSLLNVWSPKCLKWKKFLFQRYLFYAITCYSIYNRIFHFSKVLHESHMKCKPF